MNYRFSTLLAVLLAAPVAATAQTAPSMPAAAPAGSVTAGAAAPHRRHHNIYRQALDGIALSPQQMLQVGTLVKAQRMANHGVTDPAARRANALKLQDGIAAALTPAQRTQFETNLQSLRRERRAEQTTGRQPNAAATPAPPTSPAP